MSQLKHNFIHESNRVLVYVSKLKRTVQSDDENDIEIKERIEKCEELIKKINSLKELTLDKIDIDQDDHSLDFKIAMMTTILKATIDTFEEIDSDKNNTQ